MLWICGRSRRTVHRCAAACGCARRQAGAHPAPRCRRRARSGGRPPAAPARGTTWPATEPAVRAGWCTHSSRRALQAQGVSPAGRLRAGRSGSPAPCGHVLAKRLAAASDARKAEVAELHQAGARQQHVLRLDVAVDDLARAQARWAASPQARHTGRQAFGRASASPLWAASYPRCCVWAG